MRGERRAFLRVRRAGLPLARSSKRRRRRLWLCGDRVRGAQAPPPPLDRRAGRGKRGERKEGRPRGGGGGGPSGSSQPAPRRGFGSAPSPAQPPSLPRSLARALPAPPPPSRPPLQHVGAGGQSQQEGAQLQPRRSRRDLRWAPRGRRGGRERGGRRAARAPRPLSLRRRRRRHLPQQPPSPEAGRDAGRMCRPRRQPGGGHVPGPFVSARAVFSCLSSRLARRAAPSPPLPPPSAMAEAPPPPAPASLCSSPLARPPALCAEGDNRHDCLRRMAG